MKEKLTVHFKLLDYFKEILFNSNNKEQEERLRKLINYEKKQEDNLYIQKELSINNKS